MDNIASTDMEGTLLQPATQVFPPGNLPSFQTYPSVTSDSPSKLPIALKKFEKGEPKALGVTQIMIGITCIVAGIMLILLDVMSLTMMVCPISSGVMFITSGALTLSAGCKRNICLIITSLAFNVFSSIHAGVAIYIYAMYLDSPFFSLYCNWSSSDYDCNVRVIQAIVHIFLLIFTILELGVAISGFAFGCMALCSFRCCYPNTPVVIVQYAMNPVANASDPSTNH